MRIRVGLTFASVALALASASSAGAATPVEAPRAGPDLPQRSSPALARASASGKISRGQLRRKLAELARRAPGSSGFYVYDIGAKGRHVLFDRNEGKRRKLASNTKLFTTATALDRLGAEWRMETVVRARGSRNGKGRLKGDLYLAGDGDPTPRARRGSRAGQAGQGGGDQAGDGQDLRRRLDLRPQAWRTGLGLGAEPLHRAALGSRLRRLDLLGRPGPRGGGGAAQLSCASGASRSAAAPRSGTRPKKLRRQPPIASVASPTIANLVEATNELSVNFYAEMLLKRLWATPNRRGTTKDGTGAVERFARSQGSKVQALDGSGLTDNNRSSPRDVVRLLVAMREHRDGDAFVESLPVAGREGTLDERMEGTAAAGRCRAKTGTIDGVSALSGYCDAGHGRVAFSMLMNGVGDYDAARYIQDKMTIEIARYRP